MVNVRKADGTLQPFDREKVLRTCHRLKLSKSEAEEVVSELERNLFEGITTKRIMEMIFEHGERHKPHLGQIIDLREALALMRPKPDFEKFVALILEHAGYKTVTNKILQGRCIDHEIDVIAAKENDTLYVEVKHHTQFHTFTGLDTFFEVNSAFEDLVDGFASKAHKYDFTRPMLVLNTKISEHARKYSACRGIAAIGWKIPEDGGIEYYIDEKLLYPVTILKGIGADAVGKLGDVGVYTLRQLVEADQRKLSKDANMDVKILRDLVSKAEQVLSS